MWGEARAAGAGGGESRRWQRWGDRDRSCRAVGPWGRGKDLALFRAIRMFSRERSSEELTGTLGLGVGGVQHPRSRDSQDHDRSCGVGWAHCGCERCVCGGRFSRAPHSTFQPDLLGTPALCLSFPICHRGHEPGAPCLADPTYPTAGLWEVSSLFCVSVRSLRGHTWGALGHRGGAE